MEILYIARLEICDIYELIENVIKCMRIFYAQIKEEIEREGAKTPKISPAAR